MLARSGLVGKNSSRPHLGPFEAFFPWAEKMQKHAGILPIFLGGPMGPIHPVWGHVLQCHLENEPSLGRKVGGGPNPASSSRNFSDVGAGVTTASLWPRSLPSAGRGAARRAATRRQSAARVGRPTGTAFMALEAVGYWMVSGNGLGIKHEMCVMWLVGLRVKKHQQRAAGWRPLA